MLTRCRSPDVGAVAVTWLGVAGIHVSDGRSGVLIDPFVSQASVSLGDIVAARRIRSDRAAVARAVARLGPVDAIVVTHSHYDHVLDVAEFARQTGAHVYGSSTTRQIMAGAGLPASQVTVVAPGDRIGVGGFDIGFHRGRHGGVFLGAVPFPGQATAPVAPDAPARAYLLGLVYVLDLAHRQGALIYTGSAGVRSDMFRNIQPGAGPAVAILTLAGVDDIAMYLRETVGAVGATRMVPIHFDDLFRPPARPVRILSQSRFDEFVEVLTAHHPEVLFAPQPVGRACAVFNGSG